jgi:hypothetical protein
MSSEQGCQIFLGAKYQNGGKIDEIITNISKCYKIYQMAVK